MMALCLPRNISNRTTDAIEFKSRALLDDLVKRGLKTPELVIVDGAAGLEKALAALWSDMPVHRCTCTSTVIFSPTRPNGCARKSPQLQRYDLRSRRSRQSARRLSPN